MRFNTLKIAEFYKFIGQYSSPVILLEGIRSLPAEKYQDLVSFGEMLAKNLPATKFRTGNAKGSDEAFAEAVAWLVCQRNVIATRSREYLNSLINETGLQEVSMYTIYEAANRVESRTVPK